MDVEKKTEGEALKVMETFPARTLFILLLILISLVSCHKKNCMTLPSDNLPEKLELQHKEMLLLGPISLNSNGCYVAHVKNLSNGLYLLGIYVYPKDSGWKSSDDRNGSKLKMMVKNSRGHRLFSGFYESLMPYRYEWPQLPSLEKPIKEPMFFCCMSYSMISDGGFTCVAPLIDWKSTTLATHISPGQPKDPEQEHKMKHPDSSFYAKSDEKYSIHIEVEGGCPESINPQAQIGLLRLN